MNIFLLVVVLAAWINQNFMSLADIPAGTTLYRYFELEIERPSIPNVEAWYKRCKKEKLIKNM
jgi:glutathione S-transferase